MRHRKLVVILRPRATESWVFKKELDYIALAGTRLTGKRFHIAPRQRPQPSPISPECPAAASDDSFHRRFARQKRPGQCGQQQGISHNSWTADSPTSLTLREQSCVERSVVSRDEISA